MLRMTKDGGVPSVLGSPMVCCMQKGVDVDEVKKSMTSYFKDPELKVVHGGMRWHSGIVAPALGAAIPLWLLRRACTIYEYALSHRFGKPVLHAGRMAIAVQDRQ